MARQMGGDLAAVIGIGVGTSAADAARRVAGRARGRLLGLRSSFLFLDRLLFFGLYLGGFVRLGLVFGGGSFRARFRRALLLLDGLVVRLHLVGGSRLQIVL